jgi:hypothetical protein
MRGMMVFSMMTSLPFRSHLHFASYMEMQQTDFHYASHSLRGKAKRKKPKTEVRSFLRSPCAVACTLDLVGDKRSLLPDRQPGYCFSRDTETAVDVVAVSFLYSALACWSIGISDSASFQVVKKSS